MRRLFCWAAAAALVVGLPLSHLALADRPPDAGQPKVDICHIEDETGIGHVISVAEPAVPAHLGHGDCLAADAAVAEDGSCVCPAAP